MAMGKMLLENGLIACSNVTKVYSQYIWKGKFYDVEEFSASFKTTPEKKGQAIKFIKKRHPYEIPLIASKEFAINNSYKSWMDTLIH